MFEKNENKLLLLIIFIGILISFSFGTNYKVYADNIIDFPDNYLKQALLNSGVDSNGDGEISVSEAEAVTSLMSLYGGNISDITGLEYFTSLTSLNLMDNNISDISPLLKLPKLSLLALINNNSIYDDTVNNAVYLGELQGYFATYKVWVPAGFVVNSSKVSEAELDGASLELELYPTTFADSNLNKENFILEAVPSSLTIDRVEYIDSKHARLYFSHDGSDIDGNLKITIKGVELTDSSLELTFKDDIPLDIVDDNELIAVNHDGDIKEGQENGEILTVKIYGGQFTKNINSDNWTISNLPNGIAKGSMTRIDDTSVEIELSGNSTGGYNLNTINLTVSCTVDEYVDSTGGKTLEAILINDNTAPGVSSLSPTNGNDNLGYDINLAITFDENVIIGIGNISLYQASDNSLVERIDVTTGQLTGSGTKAIIIDLVTTLAGGTEYYLQIDETCFKDVKGNYYAGITDKISWKFTTVIDFPDENFKNALIDKYINNKVIDDNGDGEISVSEAKSVISWDFSRRRIRDITGLEYFTSLTGLYLAENQISDISPLSGLTTLTELNLEYNNISDISSLSGLASLEYLKLSANQISDITPLSYLSSLEFLMIRLNKISNLSPLANLTSLNNLYLAANQISDLKPLSDLKSLEVLNLNENNISDLNPLSELYFLKELYLNWNEISDLTPLSNLTSLIKLEVYLNEISNLNPLSGLTSLEHLFLPENNISDITPLSGLTSLKYLHLSTNNISDLNPLKNLLNLTEVNLCTNNISDIAPLKDLTSLTKLYLYNNHVKDTTPLSNLTALNELCLGKNNISDITPLASLNCLISLELDNNNISDISPLSELTSLEKLVLQYNDVRDIRPLSGLTTLINGYLLYLNHCPFYDSDTNNAIKLGQLGRHYYYEVWVPAGFVTDSSGMTEAELDNATIDLEIYPTTFADGSLDPANFVLENVPNGVSIESVDYIDDNECRVNLAFDGTDFVNDYTDLKLKIKAAELATDDYGYTYSASNNTQLIFEDDMPNIGASETPPGGHSVSFDDEIINNSEKDSVSFTFTNAEVNTKYDYTITSSEGGTDITGSGTVLSAGQTISGIDVSGLNDGTLTLSVILTDSVGKQASAVTDTALLDTTPPSGYSANIDQSVVNDSNKSAISFTFANAEQEATYNYSINDTNGETSAITGSGTINTAAEQISNIDVSSLDDGELTLSVTLTDTAGNTGNEATDTVKKDTVAPTLTEVTISSNNADSTQATVGDTVSLNITASEEIKEPVVTIAGNVATIVDDSDGDATTWQAEYIKQSGDPVGEVEFKIDCEDLAGNIGSEVIKTTDGSRVTFDETYPAGYSVSIDQSVINESNQKVMSFTFREAEIESIYNYSIDDTNGETSAVTGSGTINTAAEQISGIDVSSLDDGELTLSVTLTDDAGNAGTEVIDTVEKDTLISYITNFSPATGKTDVGVNDNLQLTFNEEVQLGSGSIIIKKTDDDSLVETIEVNGKQVSGGGTNTITIDPAKSFNGNTGYYVQINNTAFNDNAGNKYPGFNDKTSWEFTTIARPEMEVVMYDSYEKGDTLAAGEIITYHIEIRNTGIANLTNAEVFAQIPSNTSYVSGSTRLNGEVIADDNGDCPLLKGYAVNSSGAEDGIINQGSVDHVTIIYQTKVVTEVVIGTVISNQVELYGTGENGDLIVPVLSDDPDTEVSADATFSLVGDSAILDAVREVVDKNGGDVEAGDELQCNTLITNLGSRDANGVSLSDRIPKNTTLIPDSIMIEVVEQNNVNVMNNKAQSEILYTITEDGELIVDIGVLSPGAKILVSFEAKVDEEVENVDVTVITSQGTVSSENTPDEKTDDDGDDSNGDQANEIVVGKYPLLRSVMKLKDINGGDINPGDVIEYTINIGNKGNAPATELNITNQIPDTLEYIAESTQMDGMFLVDNAEGKSKLLDGIDYGLIEAGETVKIKYQAKIPEDTEENTIIENQAEYTAVARAEDTSNPIDKELSGSTGKEDCRIQIGGIPGKVNISGEVGSLIGNLPAGWIVEIWAGNNILGQKTVAKDGVFNFKGLSADNSYRLIVRHPETDVVYYEIVVDGLTEGSNENKGLLPMDPSGIIYDSISREPVEGATVTLIEPDGTPPVPENYLGDGQQGQVTGSDGFYRFDLDFNQASAGKYEIKVTSPEGYSNKTPSIIIEPALDPEKEAYDPTYEANPFEVVDVVTAPVIGEDTTYYLAFDLEAGDPNILNNHIPVDPNNAEILTVSKTANKRKVTIGDFVTYQIEVSNDSGQRIDSFTIYDKIPAGFKYVEGSATIKEDGGNKESIETSGERLINWSQLELNNDQSLTITYTLVVGTGVVKNQEYTNKAYVKKEDILISNIAEASVLITVDPILEGSGVIGKVFNDINSNGIQDKGESGLAGVNIVSLTGQTITTDDYGRYYLIVEYKVSTNLGQTIVLKLDTSTLPEGAEVISKNPVIIKLPVGIIQKVNFGIKLNK